jgi:hypothetical protein
MIVQFTSLSTKQPIPYDENIVKGQKPVKDETNHCGAKQVRFLDYPLKLHDLAMK